MYVSRAVLISPAFIVACLVSFRSLWTNKRQDNKKCRIELEKKRAMNSPKQRPHRVTPFTSTKRFKTMRNRWDSLLDTLADLEGTTLDRNMHDHLRLTVPPERLTAGLSQFEIVQRPVSETESSHSSYESYGSALYGHAGPVHSTWAREQQVLVGECNLPQHAEPLPSYHRPGTAV